MAAESIQGEPSPYFTDMIAFLEGGQEPRDLTAELLQKAGADCRVEMDDTKLLAPLRPRMLRDGGGFEKHFVGAATPP